MGPARPPRPSSMYTIVYDAGMAHAQESARMHRICNEFHRSRIGVNRHVTRDWRAAGAPE